MTDPRFLLTSSAAKDLVELARDLQALVDNRTAAMAQPLSGADIDFSCLDAKPAPTRNMRTAGPASSGQKALSARPPTQSPSA